MRPLEALRPKDPGVLGHHPAHLNAQPPVVVQGGEQKGGGLSFRPSLFTTA